MCSAVKLTGAVFLEHLQTPKRSQGYIPADGGRQRSKWCEQRQRSVALESSPSLHPSRMYSVFQNPLPGGWRGGLNLTLLYKHTETGDVSCQDKRVSKYLNGISLSSLSVSFCRIISKLPIGRHSVGALEVMKCVHQQLFPIWVIITAKPKGFWLRLTLTTQNKNQSGLRYGLLG